MIVFQFPFIISNIDIQVNMMFGIDNYNNILVYAGNEKDVSKIYKNIQCQVIVATSLQV